MKRSEINNKITELKTQLSNKNLSKKEIQGITKSLNSYEERLKKLDEKKVITTNKPEVAIIGESKKGGKLLRVMDSSKSIHVSDIVQSNPNMFTNKTKTKKITLIANFQTSLKKEVEVPENFDPAKDDIKSLWNKNTGDVFSYLEQASIKQSTKYKYNN